MSRAVRAVVVVAALSLVGAVVGAIPAAAARPTLRVCTANIQHTPDMPDWKVRADAKKVRSRCDLVLWQEIRERADHRAIQGRGWRSTPYGKGGVPVSWRTAKLAKAGAARIVRVSSPTPRCSNGRPSYNPSRYVGLQQLRVRSTGQRFTAASLHFPQRRTCRTADTQRRWQAAFANTRAQLPRGAVVVGGDWNRREHEIRGMRAGQHWVTPAPRSLDHVFVSGTGWRTVSKFSLNLHSDHHARGATMETRRR